LRRLDGLVRSGDAGRVFVTACLAIFDFRSGLLELTNAGHPPAYLVRAEGVEEILLPGSPLGGLGHSYGQRRLTLRPGETLVLLSDGLIEATNPAGEPFGYDSVQRVLRGAAPNADAVRARLLAAVAAHCAGHPAEDDRTLVVMRYAPPVSG
ncbi:MAG: PP2C family protein-serine/threonine phosphatase, partial [Acidobacteriota bacterium]